MHELSIAMSIIELSEDEAMRHGAIRITAVHLRVGALVGIVKDALLSSFEMAREDTLLAGAQLIVEEVPGAIYCPACDTQRPAGFPEWFCCPDCGTIASEIVQGKELELVSLEAEP